MRMAQVVRVPPDFSARHSALSKEYHYNCITAEVADPFTRHQRLHVKGALDMDVIRCCIGLAGHST